ncbi:hypothetical protein EYW49_18610 [Siculibacillus lacustris]|uniref:Uncharacterized protein n=1 Tax=Siculibacillus lacustris TaxID=1549641 RepID=A0A4Q9VGX5_9HYPH|nr:hypothetical protein [Siculibacillus lacustris]TBW34297.1 hypothetical protein EYW49_18610 [Siculibacillus lacustris]
MNSAVRPVSRPTDTAAYIEQATAELRDLATRAGFDFLAYLIDMARLEAATLTIAKPGSARPADRPGSSP